MFRSRKMKTIKFCERYKNRRRDRWCLWIGKFNIINMPILLKLIYRSNPISIKVPARDIYIYIRLFKNSYEKEKQIE